MTHTCTTYYLTTTFNPTAITYSTFITDTFVLTTGTFPVLSRSKNTFIKQAIFFWFQCTVVNSFRFLYFTIRPATDLIGRSKTDLHTIEFIDIDQRTEDRKSTRLNSS